MTRCRPYGALIAALILASLAPALAQTQTGGGAATKPATPREIISLIDGIDFQRAVAATVDIVPVTVPPGPDRLRAGCRYTATRVSKAVGDIHGLLGSSLIVGQDNAHPPVNPAIGIDVLSAQGPILTIRLDAPQPDSDTLDASVNGRTIRLSRAMQDGLRLLIKSGKDYNLVPSSAFPRGCV